ncbi:UDP-N-acetylglucosamine 2-epimerase (hydrolyzing) [Flavobacterium sp. ANB]|uniref:UDP-N-acetylglucosamine 2-epimerase n=1 Tax=unclassified Flavobacterium TaxID=196869 RepID=UPI0012B81545|nr:MULTISPECIES: UDP-N-acetylglucosamine 2-epimerase [unclassified Flavobacterium]MBF4517631.1 UDP-N-acetylglucosamine 2-epimerase (hydrolyzing) [Flavobacterium sp. ANB]MTD70358.1 UDP-N-acetylglucosamine 2-epimerase (hydrolyzing) [Flavobacterium sp. LC2016-13]
MRKICVITGTRAEYGLLYWTMKALQNDSDVLLSICVTGMHLSPEFGLTYRQIIEDGFHIDEKVETLLSSDTSVGISKSIGLGVISFSEVFNRLLPDLIVVLGDRFEIFAACTAAMISKTPIAHCHGGEATEGLIDEAIRHSITKMSQIHFTSTEEYRSRVIQLGEQPHNVFNVGALGIENINKLDLLNKDGFEKSIDFTLKEVNFLVTFHPVTLDHSSAEMQFNELLLALDKFENASIIFTKPNADTEGRVIIHMIDDYVSKNHDKAISFTSMGQLRYLSAIQFMDVIIGNSSSGLIEVPTFKKPTLNIGDRQQGRVKAISVIDCNADKIEIEKGIHLAMSSEFKEKIKHSKNPYGDRNSSDEIVKVLKTISLNNIIKKQFYNL